MQRTNMATASVLKRPAGGSFFNQPARQGRSDWRQRVSLGHSLCLWCCRVWRELWMRNLQLHGPKAMQGLSYLPPAMICMPGSKLCTAYRSACPIFPLEKYEKAVAGIGETEGERVQKFRVGQNIFRDALMEYWNWSCPLSGISSPALLRASHMMPWSDCATDAQRLDVHNGLLLSALWDAAFDAGLVTFDDDGLVLTSAQLNCVARDALALDKTPRLVLRDEHRPFLAYHRNHIWIRN